MIVIAQRVSSAQVSVNNSPIAAIKRGYLLLVGIQHTDTETVIGKMSEKLLKLRVMADETGKMNKSIVETGGSILAVSQFTLCGSAKKGNRPSFLDAMDPEEARVLFELFVAKLRTVTTVETGMFGEYMQVELVNDGPTTIILDSKDIF